MTHIYLLSTLKHVANCLKIFAIIRNFAAGANYPTCACRAVKCVRSSHMCVRRATPTSPGPTRPWAAPWCRTRPWVHPCARMRGIWGYAEAMDAFGQGISAWIIIVQQLKRKKGMYSVDSIEIFLIKDKWR